MHLSGETDRRHAGERPRIVPAQRRHGAIDRDPPVGGVLLGPARPRVRCRHRSRRLGDDPSLPVDDQGFDR